MVTVILQLLARFINNDAIAGWTRAIVASLIALLIGKWPALAAIVTPEIQAAIAVAVSGFVVGLWSQIAKTFGIIPAPQAVAALAALPQVNNDKLAAAVGPTLAKNVPRE